ncbi:MAG: hypothetical protein ABEK17_01360 [Candidatus Aenigmatarchaeota archaeon]
MSKKILFVFFFLIITTSLVNAVPIQDISINNTSDSIKLKITTPKELTVNNQLDLMKKIKIQLCKTDCKTIHFDSFSFTEGSREMVLFLKIMILRE